MHYYIVKPAWILKRWEDFSQGAVGALLAIDGADESQLIVRRA